MNQETADALIGQLAADATVRDALLIALMECLPALHSAIEAKVAAAAPAVRLGLPKDRLQAFDQRLQEVRHMMRNAA